MGDGRRRSSRRCGSASARLARCATLGRCPEAGKSLSVSGTRISSTATKLVKKENSRATRWDLGEVCKKLPFATHTMPGFVFSKGVLCFDKILWASYLAVHARYA